MTTDALKGSYTLRLGDSFDPQSKCRFSTFRYDFMPKSVDQSKPGLVEVGSTDDVTVSLAHGTSSSSSVSHTIFKGHKRPCQKECVLILDRRSGEARLERVSMSVSLKKARIEVCQFDLVEKKLGLKSLSEPSAAKADAKSDSRPDAKTKRPDASSCSPSKRPAAAAKARDRRSEKLDREERRVDKADKRPDKRLDKRPTDKEADKRPTDKEADKLLKPSRAAADDKAAKKPKKSKKTTSLSPPSSSSSSTSSSSSDAEEAEAEDLVPVKVSIDQLKDDLQLSESGSDSD